MTTSIKRFLNLLFCSLFLLTFQFTNAQDLNMAKAAKALDKRYNKIMKKNDVVGTSVAIYDKGELSYAKGFGYSDKQANVLVNRKTEFKVGSITKVFTCFAVLRLHEQGKVDINESVIKYIPEITISYFNGEAGELIIKDLMSHISGLPSDMINGMFTDTPPDFEWIVNKLNQQYMSSQPKYLMSYSNLGYGLLGELISRVSGKSYTDFMKEEVFDKIGMKQSYIFAGESSLSKAYVNEQVYIPNYIRDQAAGSMVSNVEDMCLFIRLMIQDGSIDGKQILSPESIQWMETNHLADNTIPTNEQYGFGLSLYDMKKVTKNDTESFKYVGHGGDTYAFHANFGYSSKLNLGGVVLTNSQYGSRINSISRLLDVYTEKRYDYNIENEYKAVSSESNTSLSLEKVKGSYDIGPMSLKVEELKKMQFKAGKQTIVLNQIGATNYYKIKAKLLGFIPIPIKDVQMYFEEIEGEIFLIQKQIKSNRIDVISKKSPQSTYSEAWESRLGNYDIIDNLPTNFPDVNVEGVTVTLSKLVDQFIIDFEDLEMFDNMKLYTSDESVAFTGGIGRNAHYSLTVLENGNLGFMGYELKKRAE